VQASKNAPLVRRSLSILVADDDYDTVLTLSTMLRDEGHIVHTCVNAEFVMEAIRRYKPDICILDIVMPAKTGFSIARDIIALKLPRPPVLVALSGVFSKASDEIILKSAGFDHLLRKGGDPSELFRIINEIADTDLPPEAA